MTIKLVPESVIRPGPWVGTMASKDLSVLTKYLLVPFVTPHIVLMLSPVLSKVTDPLRTLSLLALLSGVFKIRPGMLLCGRNRRMSGSCIQTRLPTGPHASGLEKELRKMTPGCPQTPVCSNNGPIRPDLPAHVRPIWPMSVRGAVHATIDPDLGRVGSLVRAQQVCYLLMRLPDVLSFQTSLGPRLRCGAFLTIVASSFSLTSSIWAAASLWGPGVFCLRLFREASE